MLTVFISTVLLFTIVGPVGRILSNGITDAMVWGTNNLGVFGYALFAGIQQLVVITGLHHIIGAWKRSSLQVRERTLSIH